MKSLLTSAHVQLLVLSIFAGTLLGCGSWFAKRQVDRNSVQKTVNEVPITVENQPSDLCPRLLQGSRSAVTNNFLYVLDTSEQKCIATKWQDLFGDGKLFPFRKEDSLVFEKKDNLVRKGEWDENQTYKQYYKGIPVEKSRVMLNLKKDKIVRLVGTFYPGLDIDTTGMISKREAAEVVLNHLGISDSLQERRIAQMLQFSSFGLLPKYNKIFYSFRFYFGPNKGTWIVDAVSGKFQSHVQPDWSHVCHTCVGGNSTIASCPVSSCNTASSTETFTDFLSLDFPTFYDNCQSIRVDSSFLGDTVYYRLSPRYIYPDDMGITDNDTINIFDASIIAGGVAEIKEERFCNKDTITTENTIAASLFYGMNLAKDYFNSRQIDDKKRHFIYAHVPAPEENEAQYSSIDDIFLFGDGNNIDFRPPVSVDIVAHEYAHAVLSHVFNINRDSVHAKSPLKKAP